MVTLVFNLKDCDSVEDGCNEAGPVLKEEHRRQDDQRLQRLGAEKLFESCAAADRVSDRV